MNSYYELELLANERVERRGADADRERIKRSAQMLARRAAWWALPWLVLLAISASAAYGMVAGAESVAERNELVSTPTDAPVSTGGCDATSKWILLDAVANGWVPTKSAGYCGDG